MRVTRFAMAAVVLSLASAPHIAMAQALSDDMSCEAARNYYAEHRAISTTENGQVLPITQGTPWAERDSLMCSDGSNRFDTMVKTTDNPECVVAVYCD